MSYQERDAQALRRVRLLELLPKGLSYEQYVGIINKHLDGVKGLPTDVIEKAREEAFELLK